MATKLEDIGGRTKLQDLKPRTRLGDMEGPSHTALGIQFTGAQKVGGFISSTIASFPELLGIEPSEKVQEYRAANPLGSFTSQALGAFVPYLGAAKALRAIPTAKKALLAVEGLGGKNAIFRAGLGAGAEAAMIEAVRVPLAASPLPESIYEGITGQDVDTRGVGTLLGEAAVNVGASAVLGGAVGGLVARFAKPANISRLVPGAHPDAPLEQQIQALNEAVARHQNPEDALNYSDDQMERIVAERDRRINWNLLGAKPQYTDTGETVHSGKYWVEDGKVFRPLQGETKSNQTHRWINNATNFFGKADKLRKARRLAMDARGGFEDEADLADTWRAIFDLPPDADVAEARQAMGMFANNARVIEINQGTGNRPMPEGYVSPLDWIRDKTGKVQEFFHGTKSDIEEGQWQPTGRGGVSFSMNPKFASNWAEYQASGSKGPRVYITAIKRSEVGDFENPADVQKALEASGNIDIPGMKDIFKKGDWNSWENLETLRKAGWDTIYMVEDIYAPKDSVGGAKNIFVTKPELIYSAFSPEVMWAKNIRGLANEPKWNKPKKTPTSKDPLMQRAQSLQDKFTKGKVFKDVGDGWKMAVETDTGFRVMAKKIRGQSDVAAPGDRWVTFRTANPEKFSSRAAAVDDEVKRSGYWPEPPKFQTIGVPLFDNGMAYRRAQEPERADPVARQTTSQVRSNLGDVAENARDLVQPSEFRFTGTGKGQIVFKTIKHLEALANGRVQMKMSGKLNFDENKTLLENLVSIKKAVPGAGTFDDLLEQIDDQDLKDFVAYVETETQFDKLQGLAQRTNADGRPLVSPALLKLMGALQKEADEFEQTMGKLSEGVKIDPLLKMVSTFQGRKGHYIMTREFPGSWRMLIEDPKTGDIVGIGSGRNPAEARQAAQDIIEQQAARGRPLREGGMFDEATRSAEELQKMKARILKPGFLKNRGDLLGYELQGKNITKDDLRDIIRRNLQRRENFVRDISAWEATADLMDDLYRTNPNLAAQLEKRLRMLRGDEGEFARAQNQMMDKALGAVGLTGNDSASKIVQSTQKVLSSFNFNFVNLSQPVTNITGIFQTLLPMVAYTVRATPEMLARLYTALPLMDGANNVRGTLGVLSPMKVMRQAFGRLGTKWGDQPEAYREYIDLLAKQQIIAPRWAEEAFGVDGSILSEPISMFKSTKSFVRYWEAANQLLVSKSEEISRVVTVNAAWEMAQAMGLDTARSVIFARDMVAKVNYNYANIDRALMATTPIGSLMGTFKNWSFHYMSSMLMFANSAVRREPGALEALMWQTASTGLIGGTVALPVVKPLLDGASKFLTDQSAMQNLYAMTGGDGMDERVADGLMFGVPGFFGMSLAAQTSSPGSDPARDINMLWSFAAVDRMKALSAGVKDAMVAYSVTGETPFEDENVRNQLIRALAPRSIFRSMQVTSDNAIRSMSTGYDVTNEMGMGSLMLFRAGFNPTELEKTYDVYNEIRNDQRKQKVRTQEFGQTLAQAWEAGDTRLANEVFTRAMAVGVDTSSVLRSAQARQKRGMETQLEFTASPEDMEDYGFMFDE
jgi:hypothetical protein